MVPAYCDFPCPSIGEQPHPGAVRAVVPLYLAISSWSDNLALPEIENKDMRARCHIGPKRLISSQCELYCFGCSEVSRTFSRPLPSSCGIGVRYGRESFPLSSLGIEKSLCCSFVSVSLVCVRPPYHTANSFLFSNPIATVAYNSFRLNRVFFDRGHR